MKMISQKLLSAALALGILTGLSACLGTEPKNLGSRLISFDGINDTTTPENFRFNFAYNNSAAVAPLNKVVYLQGSSNSKGAINATCNLAGTGCACEFYNAADVLLETTDTSEISYDSTGNYLRCEYDGAPANLKKVRVKNISGTKYSATYPVDVPGTLTLQKLIGPDQDINQVRTVSRYTCLYNFLQKQGTTDVLFDCTSQGSLCWSGFTNPDGLTGGDFCLLQVTVPFHLYRSNYENNYSSKFADKLYNAEVDGKVCQAQVKQYDCGGTGGVPVKDFGVYNAQVGIFDTPLSLTSAPGLPVITYGYGAAVSSYGGANVCPPGMVKRIFFRATTTTASGIGPSHNMPDTLTATEIRDPTSAPSPLEVNKTGGGDCSGSACTLPMQGMGLVTNYGYSSAGQNEFCVIDPTLLPGT